MYRTLWLVAALLAACGVESPKTSREPKGAVEQSATSGAQPACPDASEPEVHYVGDSPQACAAAFFQCGAGQTTFNDACGCGCIGPASPPPPPPPPPPACPDASDPGVHYLSADPLTCAAAFFQCGAGQATFNDNCGCGCID